MNKIDIYKYMTENMKDVLLKQEELNKDNPPCGDNFEIMRDNYNKERAYWNSDSLDLEEKKVSLNGPHGKVDIYIYYPNEKQNLNCSVFIHGGGYLVGSPKTHERMIKIFAKQANCAVIAVDYKLSPEYKFPVAIQECAFVTKYIHENADSLRINKNNISLMGDSAGANLALSTHLYLRDNEADISYIKSLHLYYGLYGLKDSKSRRLLGGSWDSLTKEDLEYYENCYFKEDEQAHESIYYNNLSADLSYKIPPVYMCVGDLDPLLDDSRTLKRILDEHNIKCELEVYRGVLHAFLHYSKMLPQANEALKHSASFFNKYQ